MVRRGGFWGSESRCCEVKEKGVWRGVFWEAPSGDSGVDFELGGDVRRSELASVLMAAIDGLGRCSL